jgi:hypothetical protein
VYRGAAVRVQRATASPTSRLRWETSPLMPPLPTPDCPDLAATLRNLFGVARLPAYCYDEDVADSAEGGAP